MHDFALCAKWRAQLPSAARDFASVQPFFYYYDGRSFICASEPQQILIEPSVPLAPDETVIGVYLSGMLMDPAATVYRDIRKLEGGCSITVGPGKIKGRRYFDIDPAKAHPVPQRCAIRRAFESLFKEAVRCRMRNIGGVVSELSGGLDSSLVVGTIQRLLRQEMSPNPGFETFSIKFDDPQADERGFIGDVAAMWDWKPTERSFLPKFSDYLADVRRYRYLSCRPNSAMDTLMHRAIRERGYRVVLTGQGGDQWFRRQSDCFADLFVRFQIRRTLQAAAG